MKKLLFVCIFLSLLSISCSSDCDCSEAWDSTITYVPEDIVSHDGKCWVAINQGRGILPGPWLENGNDIWEECLD